MFSWWLSVHEGDTQKLTSAVSHPLSDLYQSRHDRPVWKSNKHMYASHLYAIIVIHVLMLKQKHTGVNAQTHMHGYVNTHTHTPPYSSKVHLSRWQLDPCWGGVCQAESLAWLVGARTSWETFWHTFRGCSVTVYVCVHVHMSARVCLQVCVHARVNVQLFKTPSSSMARSSPSSVSACAWQEQAWQGAAHFVRLPVDIKHAYSSTWTPFLPPLSLHICVLRHLFTSWYPQSICPCRLGEMYWMLFLPTTPSTVSTGNVSVRWCNWMFLRLDWQR